MTTAADTLIEQLQLQPHPEGGWYRETWRAPVVESERAAGTAIYFLLKAGEASAWHRIDAHEVWLWHGGDPLVLSIRGEDGAVAQAVLGGDIGAG